MPPATHELGGDGCGPNTRNWSVPTGLAPRDSDAATTEAPSVWLAVADDGARGEFIGAGALASFLGLVRRWLRQGYDVLASEAAVVMGLEPSELRVLAWK